jgi:hypothetical protein
LCCDPVLVALVEMDTALYDAALAGDVEEVNWLVAGGADVEAEGDAKSSLGDAKSSLGEA